VIRFVISPRWSLPRHRVQGQHPDRRNLGQGGIATTSPQQQGIYLNEEWLLDETGNIYAKLPGTWGALIPDLREVRAIKI
jgi:hypothetical protein